MQTSEVFAKHPCGAETSEVFLIVEPRGYKVREAC